MAEEIEYEKNLDGTFKLDNQQRKIPKKKETGSNPETSGNEREQAKKSDLEILRARRRRVTFDPKNPTSSPSKDFIRNIQEKDPTTLNIASDDVVKAIAADWTEHLKVPEAETFNCIFDVVWYCYHNSSSDKTKFVGRAKCGVELENLASTVRSYCSLRSFCSKYAPIVWDFAISNDIPPANWQRRKVIEGAKFAAFDFFEAVTSAAALQPIAGLVRNPTDKEMIAGASLKEISLMRDEIRRGTSSTLMTEVTGGRTGQVQPIKKIGSDE
uniref:Capsid protein n=1 Tax=Cherry rusty mottle associated virus TaxID=1312929 RepID=A0A0U2D8D0_9VIRU|nr:coat protein [Cherry rusty mottle associated virus]